MILAQTLWVEDQVRVYIENLANNSGPRPQILACSSKYSSKKKDFLSDEGIAAEYISYPGAGKHSRCLLDFCLQWNKVTYSGNNLLIVRYKL